MVQPATAQAIIQATTFDIFNTASLPARHELMAQYWSSNIVAHPPTGNTGTGFSTIDRMYDELDGEEREAWTFTKDGGMWINGDCIIQKWRFGPNHDDPKGWKGWDVILLDADDKVRELYGMVEGLNTPTL